MRSPSSGSATDREQPDILAGDPTNDTTAYAIELKTTSKDHAYIRPDEADALRQFALGFNAVPLAVARWSGDRTFYAYPLDDLDRTPNGKYAMHKQDRDDGMILPP